jgi:3-dehydroquinate synthase
MKSTSPIFLDTKPVSYVIGDGALSFSEKLLLPYPRVIVLVDENVEEHCLPVFRTLLPSVAISDVICIHSGEEKKNLDQLAYVWNQLTAANVDRDALLINLGGGVVTDIGGFVASTFKRGIRFVNYPTSLLGMVDAAIGGKTGIDFGNIKNQVGVFADPDMVVIDPVFLKTLEEKQWQSGFAEVLKYGLIMDRELWRWLYGSHFRDISDWNKVITRAARDKIDIVRHDFMEKGIRKNLNYGHTLGHAFESFFLRTNHPVTHGQAIAAGMICEGWLSQKAYELDVEQLVEVVKMFDINFERLPISEENIPVLLELMRQDKKARGGILNYSLLRKIGKAIHNIEVETPLVIESLKYYINGEK